MESGAHTIGERLRAACALQPEPTRFGAGLLRQDWPRLASILEKRALAPGELLLRRGESDGRAWLLEEGQLQVWVPLQGASATRPPMRIATLGPGALIGEPALFAPTPRVANVEALGPALAWALPLPRLLALAPSAPLFVLEVMRSAGAVMAQRMRDNLERGMPVA